MSSIPPNERRSREFNLNLCLEKLQDIKPEESKTAERKDLEEKRLSEIQENSDEKRLDKNACNASLLPISNNDNLSVPPILKNRSITVTIPTEKEIYPFPKKKQRVVPPRILSVSNLQQLPLQGSGTLSSIDSHEHMHSPRKNIIGIVSPRFLNSNASSSFNIKQSSTTEEGFEKNTTELLKINQKKHKFYEQRAAHEIVCCIGKPGGIEHILNLFSQYHHLSKDKWLRKRWTLLLTTTFLYPQSVPLILTFIKKESINPDNFAQLVISGFHLKRTSSVEASYILSLYTLEDLKGQDPKTLFREAFLSSSLHKEYGAVLLEPFIKQMKKEVIAYWKKRASVLDLCINDKKIHQILLNNQQNYGKLEPVKQVEIHTEVLIKNIEACKHFFTSLLEKLYETPIPSECQNLLSMRRSQIYEAIQVSASAEVAFIQSEILVGEIFFLRILNPSLLHLGKLPAEVDALINLAKMVQALSNQVKFGMEKRDEVFESFNDIYERFIAMHHEFINKNFPLRSI